MTTSILGLKNSHAHYIMLSMPTNAASITVLNNVILGCRDLSPFQLCSIRSNPRDLNLSCWEARMGAEASNSACPSSLREHLSYL